ncbi:MAG: LysR substrate-binding domain-containing protein [Pseudomonadota bacterium]
MDIEALRLFVSAAEKLNISSAGQSLGLSPAMSSARLAKLERELSAELLHRTTRKVSLSQEGAAFLPYAREIIAQTDAGRAALGQGNPSPSGILRFAAPSSYAQRHIIPLLPAFHALYPDITLDLRLSDLRADLIEGSFDLALRSAPLQDSSLKGRKLAEDIRILCAAPAYLEARGTPKVPEGLMSHDFLAWGNIGARELIDPNGAVFLLEPKTMQCRAIFDDGTSQREATLAGAGLSINSLWSVAAEIATGRLIHVLPEWKLNDQSVLWLIYPRSNVLTPKVRCLMDFLIERLGQ